MSWDQLTDILREAEALYAEDNARTPESCPKDGTPLKSGPRGELYCPFDGWQPDSVS